MVSAQELREKIGAVPRVSLAYLPTPLEDCPRLSEALGGPRIFIKRDDLTGLAMGGNEARTLEFALAEARSQDADTLVAGGGVSQSNFAQQVAAAAAKLGLRCVLVLRPGVKGLTMQGNLLLDHVLGAEVRLVEPANLVVGLTPTMEEVAERLRKGGRRPFVVHPDAPGALAYVECAVEIAEQLAAMETRADHVFVASGGGTQAGLVAGGRALGFDFEVVGISPARGAPDRRRRIADLASETARRLDLNLSFAPDDITNLDDYVGVAHGMPTKASIEAMALVARTEGIIIDPITTGKAFVALMDFVRKGRLGREHSVVFVHTGGTAALFAYYLEVFQGLPETQGGGETRK